MTQDNSSLLNLDIAEQSKSTSMIEIMDSVDLLISSPREDRCLRQLRVTPINRLDELHFILQAGSDDGGFELNGYEREVCLQVLRALSDITSEREIDKVFFYARYDGVWNKVTFTEFDGSLIEKSWPDCDSGAALIGLTITGVLKSELTSGITDDQSSSAFGYWWRSLEAINKLFDLCWNEIEDVRGWTAETVKIGSAVIDVNKYIGVTFLFAIDQRVLLDRLQSAKNSEGFIGSSDTYSWEGCYGWVCYYSHVKESKLDLEIVEPGEIEVDAFNWEQYKSKIIENNGVVIEVGEDIFDVEIATEIDMTKPSGGFCKLLKRGAYRFKRVDMSDSWDDDVPF